MAEFTHTLTQFFCPGEIEATPGGGFSLIAQLFEGVRLQILRDLVIRVGGYHLFEQFGCPAIVALVKGITGKIDSMRGSAQCFDIALAHLHLAIRMEVGRITIVIAEIVVVDRAGVMAHGAVVTAAGPVVSKRRR